MEIVQWTQRASGVHTVHSRGNGEETDNYCVLLPFLVNTGNGTDGQDADRTQNCAIVFDDWDVVNTMGVKDRVDLGGLLFGR